jgi:hypothetical protein
MRVSTYAVCHGSGYVLNPGEDRIGLLSRDSTWRQTGYKSGPTYAPDEGCERVDHDYNAAMVIIIRASCRQHIQCEKLSGVDLAINALNKKSLQSSIIFG